MTRRRLLTTAASLLAVIALVLGGIGIVRSQQSAPQARLTLSLPAPHAAVAVRTAPARAAGAPPDSWAVPAKSASLTVYATPATTTVQTTLANPTPLFHAPLILLATDLHSHPGWYQVSTPIRPNNTRGWVRASDVKAPVVVPYQLTVVQHLHQVTLWRSGTKVRSFPVAIGKPATPSPNGLFFINAIIDNRGGDQAYGPWVMALSGYSDVYQTFNGGDALIGMHGTDEDSTVGTTASHGCFRMHDADATTLSHIITLATPVYVTP